MVKEELLKDLSNPDVHKELKVFPKWRIDAKVGNRRVILPYYEADQCREILDEVLGIANWQAEPRGINGKLFFSIGINVENEGWIYKADAGGERNPTKKGISEVDSVSFRNKTEASNAFVRASRAWGIGRHLKKLPEILLEDSGGYGKVKTPGGSILQTPEQLSAYCNNFTISQWLITRFERENKELFSTNERLKEALEIIKESI